MSYRVNQLSAVLVKSINHLTLKNKTSMIRSYCILISSITNYMHHDPVTVQIFMLSIYNISTISLENDVIMHFHKSGVKLWRGHDSIPIHIVHVLSKLIRSFNNASIYFNRNICTCNISWQNCAVILLTSSDKTNNSKNVDCFR